MMRKLREARDEEGFTLIELLVVVLIIGILAAIAIPVFLDQRQKAYRDAVESDMRNLALVVEDYASDNNGLYPNDAVADTSFTLSDGVNIQTWVVDTTGADAGYCMEGRHTAFGADENWIYNARGVTTAAVTHFADGSGTCPAATA